MFYSGLIWDMIPLFGLDSLRMKGIQITIIIVVKIESKWEQCMWYKIVLCSIFSIKYKELKTVLVPKLIISHSKMMLGFRFAKSNGNQNWWSKGNQKWRWIGPGGVYANPDVPWICPFLAFIGYLFYYSDVLCGDAPLFEGSSQDNWYST